MINKSCAAAAACLLAGSALLAIAAPGGAGETREPHAAPPSARPEGTADKAAGATGNKAIDLLLQMQAEAPENPTAGGAERAAAPNRGAQMARQPAAAASNAEAPPTLAGDSAALDQLKNSMMSLGVVRPQNGETLTAEQQEQIEQRRRLAEAQRQDSQPESQPGSVDRSPASSGSAIRDLAFIRFIRENRALVVFSSVALLAVVWFAANFSMLRRRH